MALVDRGEVVRVRIRTIASSRSANPRSNDPSMRVARPRESTLQIYGTLTEDLIQTISVAAQTEKDDNSVTIREPFTGFDRLPQR
jgi:hypothetical protein